MLLLMLMLTVNRPLHGDILQVPAHLVAKYQMSSGPHGHIFFLPDI